MTSYDEYNQDHASSSSSTQQFAPSHQPSSSSDFGAFESAPDQPPSPHLRNVDTTSEWPITSPTHRMQRAVINAPSLLDDEDLLGSFDHPISTRNGQPLAQKPFQLAASLPTHVDLLGGDVWEDATPQYNRKPTKVPPSTPHYSPGQSGSASPIHVPLPPRPTEISADYNPPLRSPRRMSSFAAGLSSPPIVTDAGNDIIFYPAHQARHEDAASEIRRVQKHDPGIGSSTFSHPHPTSSSLGTDLRRTTTRSPPQHSKLLDTLATTTRIASKWRSAISSSTFSPPGHLASPEIPPSLSKASDPIPIDITHRNPFATAEQLAGSYMAPSGAPGFDPRRDTSPRYNDVDEEEWGHLALSGRRETTAPVLTVKDADKLRSHLPPRQRLSGAWTLLFSLDQHGASLSTLYRLVDKFAQTHRSSGNILIVRDGQGHRFGAFINECIVKREGTYYGSGESFLFKLGPSSDVQAYRWTGKNQYFALCESGFISFGGGDGTYGLLLDSTFTQNSSATSPAYDNDILSEARPRKSSQASLFDCIGLEVWAT